MGCSASAESVLGEGSFTIDTRGVSTKAVGASAGIRFGVHRIAKAELNSGKEQDRFSFLLRENAQQQPTESDESASASNWNAETGGSFALGIFDGHGETPKAADIAADRLLKRVFENHFKFVQTNIDSPPPSPNPSGFSKSPSMEDLTKALALPKRDPGKREKVRSPRENTREELKEIDHDDTDVVLEAFRKALVPYLAPGSAKKGEVVMSQGDSGDFVVFVAEGSVDITVDKTFVGTQEAGAIIGEIALLKTTERTATVVCKSSVVSFWVLSRGDWEAVLGLDKRFDAVRRRLSDLADDRLGCTAFLERLKPSEPPKAGGDAQARMPQHLVVDTTHVEVDLIGVASPPTPPCQGQFPRPTDATISRAFVDVDLEIRREWPQMRTGTTATVLILSPRSKQDAKNCIECDTWNATLAWAGDSRAMMILPSDDGKLSSEFIEVTKDHNVDSEDERNRIMKTSLAEKRMSPGRKSSTAIRRRESATGQKGPIAVMNDENGVSLRVTRSLGDPYASAAVIPHPQINRPSASANSVGVPRRTRFIVASDGLWDVMKSESAVALCRSVSDPSKAAEKLARIAADRWRYERKVDDVVVAVIDLV